MRRLAVFLALSGCSFAFVTGPPPNHAQLSYFDCTTSRLAPVLDTALTALMLLDVISLGATSDNDWARTNSCNVGDPNCPVISRHGAMLLDGALGVAGAAGMAFGWSRTSQCRSAKAEQAARGPQQPYMPGSWPPPQGTWPPPQQPGPPQPPQPPQPAQPPQPPQPPQPAQPAQP